MTVKTASSIKIEQPTEETLVSLGVQSWPIWTKEASLFDWHYDQQEKCYILEGEVTVMAGGQSTNFGKGDLVTFPEGLSCKWHVKKAVRKHYKFG